MGIKRWHIVITYSSHLPLVDDMEELEELQELIERGPEFKQIENVVITYNHE